MQKRLRLGDPTAQHQAIHGAVVPGCLEFGVAEFPKAIAQPHRVRKSACDEYSTVAPAASATLRRAEKSTSMVMSVAPGSSSGSGPR